MLRKNDCGQMSRHMRGEEKEWVFGLAVTLGIQAVLLWVALRWVLLRGHSALSHTSDRLRCRDGLLLDSAPASGLEWQKAATQARSSSWSPMH